MMHYRQRKAALDAASSLPQTKKQTIAQPKVLISLLCVNERHLGVLHV